MSPHISGSRGLPLAAIAAAAAALAAVLAGCSSSHSSAEPAAAAGDTSSTVTVSVTPQGCAPKPASITAGAVDFNVANKDAGAISEAELRTSDLSKILGEQENLTPGLSGGFSLTLQPGKYVINCPGASQQHWMFTVTGKTTTASWQTSPQLTAAVSGYTSYINQNTAALVSSTRTFCQAIDAGNNEAATAKISGEEERYSNTDLPVLQANVDGAMEVVSLLTPFLDKKDPGLLSVIDKQNAAVTTVMSRLKASPGYDDTGYVEYSATGDGQKKQLSGAINALAEDLSKLSQPVSS